MSCSEEKIEIIFKLDSLDAATVARQIFDSLEVVDEDLKLYQVSMSKQAALSKLEKERKHAFQLDTGSLSIHFSTVRSYRHQLLTIFWKGEHSLSVWEEILNGFLKFKGFVQACLVNNEYSFWQNAYDPIQYEALGRSWEGLPMISNGLPPPLEKAVIDISNNPGRRIIKVGYVEMIGRAMWFGQPFWDAIGDDKLKTLLSQNIYKVDKVGYGVIRGIFADCQFLDESSSETQREIRKLLFG